MAISLKARSAVMILTLTAAVGCSPNKPQAGVIYLHNAAVDYCLYIGGQPDSRQTRAGKQFGFCRLLDGSVCEEWTLLRRDRCVPPRGGGIWDDWS